MYSRATFIAAILVLTGGAAVAQNAGDAAKPACSGENVGLPEALSGWADTPMPIATAHDTAEAGKTQFPLGQRIAFQLAKTDTIRFAHAPDEQMPKQYVYSGMLSFHVPKNGNYSVMISEANWIDVVQSGKLVTALEMRGRIPCAKYGKKIDFPLKGGNAIVQFFGAPYDTVDVLIAPAP